MLVSIQRTDMSDVLPILLPQFNQLISTKHGSQLAVFTGASYLKLGFKYSWDGITKVLLLSSSCVVARNSRWQVTTCSGDSHLSIYQCFLGCISTSSQTGRAFGDHRNGSFSFAACCSSMAAAQQGVYQCW